MMGLKGTKGVKGEKGQQGVKGEKGTKGQKGVKGQMGVKGEKGIKGQQGVKGIHGLKGEKGRKGQQGQKGQKGMDGLKGENPPLTIGTSDELTSCGNIFPISNSWFCSVFKKKTFSDAETFCEQNGMKLFVPNNVLDLEKIQTELD